VACRVVLGATCRARERLRPEDQPRELFADHPVFRADSLVLPEIAKPLGRKLAISNRMLDVLVAEIVLQRPSTTP
jgi:hypothetical protein